MSPPDETDSFASAEAVFGSTSRGDTDRVSDRDILIVDSDVVVLKARALALETEGWSVAAYTFAKLHYLAQRGALFIQHLKLESTILRDREQRLSRLLEDFTPLTTYHTEIRANDRLAHLAGVTPSGSRGALLAADVLYVALRNFGILRLAERGIHTYAFSSILEALESERIIPPAASRALLELRFLKCLYRAGERDDSGRVRRAVLQALAVLPSAHFPRKLDILNPRAIVLAPAPRIWESAYFQLRDLERRFVALKTLRPKLQANAELATLSKWIADPRRYASISRRLAPHLRRTLLVQAAESRHLAEAPIVRRI